MGKADIVIEFGRGPDFTGFDSPMVRGRHINKIRFFSILEVQLDIFKDSALIAFDGEVIMGLTFNDQIIGDLVLS